MNKKTALGHGAAAVTSIVWGATFVSTRLLMELFTPMEILIFRFILGLAGLCLLSPGKLRVKDPKHKIWFLLAGVSGINLFYLSEHVAMLYTSTSNVSVIVSSAPFFTGILMQIFSKEEKLNPGFFAGCGIALAGVAWLSLGTGSRSGLSWVGDLLSLAAAFLWACYSMLSKKISKLGYDELKVTKRIFIYGIISMLPFLPFMEFQWKLSRFLDIRVIGHFAFLGLCASALCFVLWNKAIAILGAMKSSVYIYLIPLVTVFASMIVLGEKLTIHSAGGISLIAIGLYLSEKKSRVEISA